MPNNHQHGFREGRSCLTNLLTSLEEWTKAVYEGHAVDVIYLDIAKAFDTTPHKTLEHKMRLCGLDGKVLGWLSDFLSKRKMRVCVREAQSEWRDVTSSVPQGSVGGPTSVFIDDMADDISSRTIQFADDTKLWKIINNEEDKNELQKDLERLEDWSDKWLLKFNPKKCEVH